MTSTNNYLALVVYSLIIIHVTASNVITLRMANRRRITLNYHQLAYAMGSVAMCFLSSHFLDTENSFDTRQAVGGAMGIRALYYYTAIAFVFVACLALAYWYFIERIEIKDLCESHFLVKQEYNRLTKLDTLISLFYFAQVFLDTILMHARYLIYNRKIHIIYTYITLYILHLNLTFILIRI